MGKGPLSKVLSPRTPSGNTLSTFFSHRPLGEEDAQEEQVSDILTWSQILRALLRLLLVSVTGHSLSLCPHCSLALYKPQSSSENTAQVNTALLHDSEQAMALEGQEWPQEDIYYPVIVKVGSAPMTAVTSHTSVPSNTPNLLESIPVSLGDALDLNHLQILHVVTLDGRILTSKPPSSITANLTPSPSTGVSCLSSACRLPLQALLPAFCALGS